MAIAVVALLSLAFAGHAAAAPLPLGPPSLREHRATTTVAPGVTWTRIVRGSARPGEGPWRVNVLRSAPGTSVDTRLSNDVIAGLERPSSTARRAGALAGVNGPYYDVRGEVVGAVVTRGQLVSEPVDGRSALVVPGAPGAAPRIASLSFRGEVDIAGRRRLLDGVDRYPGIVWGCGGRGGDRPTQLPRHGLICTDRSELIKLDLSFGRRTPPLPSGVEAIVDRSGTVSAVERSRGGTPIPRSGYVLAGTGDAAAYLRRNARPGRPVQATTGLMEGRRPLLVSDLVAVMSGGPRLVRNGRVDVTSRLEGFGPDWKPSLYQRFVIARNPRTLAGVSATGDLLLVTIDGRLPGLSAGASLPEAARVMKALGARDALNLDGGGSTTMAVRGRVVNHPSDRVGERPVGAGVFLFP
jgi:hypothetical protein